MKNYFLGLTVLLILSLTASAALPSDQSIEQMMRVMQGEKMLHQTLAQMEVGMPAGVEQGLQQAMQGETPTDAQEAQIADFQRRALLRENEGRLAASLSRDLYPGRDHQHHCLL